MPNLYLLIKAYGDKYKYINPIIVLIVPLTLIVSFGCPINELFPINWIVFAFYGLALGARKLDERKLRDEDDKSTVRIEKGNASMLGV